MGSVFSVEARNDNYLPPKVYVIFFSSPNEEDKDFAAQLAPNTSNIIEWDNVKDLPNDATPRVILFSCPKFNGKPEELKRVLTKLRMHDLQGVVAVLVEEKLYEDKMVSSQFKAFVKDNANVICLTEKWANNCVNTPMASVIAGRLNKAIAKKEKELAPPNDV